MNKVEELITKTLIQKEHNELEKSKLIYGVKIIVSDFYKLFSVYIIAILLNCFFEVLITHVSFYFLRQVCFGYHFRSNMECLLASILLFPLLTKFISLTQTDYFTLFLAIVSLAIILIYAPVGTKKHSIVSKKHQLYLRGKMYKRMLILFIIILLIPHEFRKFVYLGIAIESLMILIELFLGGKNNYEDD